MMASDGAVAAAEPGAKRPHGTVISRRVVMLGASFFLAFMLVFWLGWMAALAGAWSPEGGFPKVDFFSYWTASSLVLDGHAIEAYDDARMAAEQSKLPGDDAGYFEWLYPPSFFLYVLPLSLLPLVPSLIVWLAATGGLALAAVRRFSTETPVMLLAIAFPATFWNLVIGQNGLLTAGLFTWAVLLLPKAPVAGGVVFGLMAYKPQFFPLILLALVAGGQRAAAVAAAATALSITLLSLALFGLESWERFVSTAIDTGDFLYSGEAPVEKIQSVSAALLYFGAPRLAAQITQAAVSVGCAVCIVWLWRRNVAFEYKAAGLALATLLATPYSYHYDLTLMGPALLWLGLKLRQEGFRAGEPELLAFAWLSPLLSLIAGGFVGLAGVLALVALLTLRVRAGQAPRQRMTPAMGLPG
jgi:Glycosyltransferase family 87